MSPRGKATRICFFLIAALGALTASVLFLEPFHFILGLLLPIVLYLEHFARAALVRGNASETVAVPAPAWHKDEEPADFSSHEAAGRTTFWVTFIALVTVSCTMVGTAILKFPWELLYAGGHDYETIADDSDDDNLTAWCNFVDREPILCAAVVLAHLTMVTKVVLAAALSGRPSAMSGLDFEAYAEVLLYGMVIINFQAAALRVLRPARTFGAGAFATVVFMIVAPFLADPFDVFKDCIFAGVALQTGMRSEGLLGQVFGRVLGWLSLALLWAVHVHMLRTPRLREELASAYLGVLLMKPQSHRPRHRNRTPEASKGRCAAGCRAMFLTLWKALFKQSTPERRHALTVEDGPQGVLAVVFSIWAIQPFVVAANIIVPLLRWYFAWAFYKRILEREIVLDWLAREWVAALQDNLAAKAAFFKRHLFSASTGLGRALAVAFKTDCTLQQLDLRAAAIGDAGAAALAEALKASSSLQQLYLCDNRIGDEGAAALAEALEANTSLLELDLYSNAIGDDGAAAMAGALEANVSLQELDLYSNGIGDAGAAALAEALAVNGSLLQLYLGGNPAIGPEGLAALSAAREAGRVRAD